MKMRNYLTIAFMALFLTACGGSSTDRGGAPDDGIDNGGGTPVTAILTPVFAPADGNLPFPINLLFIGTTDLTLNIPVEDPTDFSDPAVALSSLDGFSTVAPWAVNFVGRDGTGTTVDPDSVVSGSSVRVFEVTTVVGTIAPNGIVAELVPGQEFVAVAASAQTVAIVPTRPLKELTTYMVVMTTGITDSSGNDATPDQTYFITQRTSPLVDAGGNSTDPLLDNATAQALEPLRQITNAQEAVAAAGGVDRASIVLSYTISTQSISPVTAITQSTVQPAAITVASAGIDTSAVGGAGIADIYVGVITMPYYGGVPSAENPTAPLNQFWQAAPGAYIPPFDAFGLDPTSTAITVANPIPVIRDMQTVPVLLTVPNDMPKPAAGWPVVVFQHGITRNRTDMLAISETMASQGFAVIAIDQPLHGIVPAVDPQLASFYIENTPFGAFANERTFDVDYVSNTTGAPGPDGITDSSGTHSFNLASLLTSRDNNRQATIDLSVLSATIFAGISIDGDANPDLDGGNMNFVGHSFGSIVGIPFLAVDSLISNAVLSVPGGGIVNLLLGSEAFGPRIRAGLSAAGLEPGTPGFQAFVVAAQTILDAADPINWAAASAGGNTILLHEVIGDAVIPNSVPGAPLSGTEPLIAAMGLATITETVQDAAGIRGVARFIPPATHGSLLRPADSPSATFEMHRQMASMILSGGTAVGVNDPTVLVPE
ncbi:MAG: Ig-like domain-containing protein [Xanthomonadales bacterium]|nr:Ig-like domain-containing protein [Xanthomonadales bacterium]